MNDENLCKDGQLRVGQKVQNVKFVKEEVIFKNLFEV